MNRGILDRRRSRGFGSIDAAVTLALLAALFYVLLDRVLYMQEMSEKTEMEETVRTIEYALRLEAASRLARGKEAGRLPLEDENPVKWLQAPPRNYLGEMVGPPAHARPAFWYYDPAARQLVYRPNLTAHLRIAGLEGKEVRFVVRQADDALAVRLVARPPYAWF